MIVSDAQISSVSSTLCGRLYCDDEEIAEGRGIRHTDGAVGCHHVEEEEGETFRKAQDVLASFNTFRKEKSLSDEQKWPDVLWIVRHGESAGNVARDAAEAEGLALIDIPTRDIDVPLSTLGERQATALGNWFRRLPPEQQPTVVLTSPYVRARETARLVLEAADIDREKITLTIDERLREKEFGVLDRLTRLGIREKFPELAEARSALGKFYFRPPGGESWCDVILRLRSVIDAVTRDYRRERVLVVSHQVVVNCFRYLLERMTEEQILALDREKEIANCSVTSYEFNTQLGRRGKLQLQLYNFVAPLEEAGAPVTTKPDVPVAPK